MIRRCARQPYARLARSFAAVGLLLLSGGLTACAKRSRAPLPPAPLFRFVSGYHIGVPATASIGVGVSRVSSRVIGRWEACAVRDGASGQRRVKVGCSNASDSVWASSWHADRALFVIAEPGLRGGRLSLGHGVERGNSNGSDLVTSRISLYRRWNTGDRDPGGTYLGIEGSAAALGAFPVGLRVGVFGRIAGPVGGARTFLAFDFPIGY
jgi:hypothetical protein